MFGQRLSAAHALEKGAERVRCVRPCRGALTFVTRSYKTHTFAASVLDHSPADADRALVFALRHGLSNPRMVTVIRAAPPFSKTLTHQTAPA